MLIEKNTQTTKTDNFLEWIGILHKDLQEFLQELLYFCTEPQFPAIPRETN